MIKRILEEKLLNLATQFPALGLMGARQSGKTTLAKHAFPHLPYVSLENPDTRLFATEDPRRFLATYETGAIFDEIQKTPDLFSYLQGMIDENPKPGRFILTGSQNFLLHEKISQSLAGRISLQELLPLSLEELKAASLEPKSVEEILFKGFYPSIQSQKIQAQDWFPSYVQTYLERDVREVKNINDLGTFQLFLRLCAGRVGQLVNLSAIGNECGISHSTAKAWISLLEASFIVYLMPPHHKNFNKRLVKMPKLYFHDPGLAAHLLGIQNPEQISSHPSRGALFENMIVSEVQKFFRNKGQRPPISFWRDQSGNEVDLLIEQGQKLLAIEIKSGQTITPDQFLGLKRWSHISNATPEHLFLIYGGQESRQLSTGTLLPWTDLSALWKELEG